MGIEPYELEEIPPQGHVKIVYTGSVAPHWEIHRVFGDQRAGILSVGAIATVQGLISQAESLPDGHRYRPQALNKAAALLDAYPLEEISAGAVSRLFRFANGNRDGAPGWLWHPL